MKLSYKNHLHYLISFDKDKKRIGKLKSHITFLFL